MLTIMKNDVKKDANALMLINLLAMRLMKKVRKNSMKNITYIVFCVI